MVAVITYIKRAWSEAERGHFECRRCGTTLDGLLDSCPECGSGDIAHYEAWILE